MGAAPPSGATIRVAVADDIAAVLRLWLSARSLAASLPDDEESVQTLLRRDSSALLVAERDRRLIGALIAAWDGWRGSMYRLAVEPEHLRDGIASQLVAEGEQLLRERGARRISAIVGETEAAATALWRSAGYELDDNVSRFVKNL
jgi:ribosomal protein S18 acetylase RimI-like enzyme